MSVVRIADKYELIRKLGEGGMAEVFLARYEALAGIEKLVVVKRIRPELARNEEFVKLFLDEARTAADLRHPNVVAIYEIGEHEDTYYMVMEYLHGRNLRRVWRRAAKMEHAIPWGQSLQIVVDVARGLHYAHEKTDLRGRKLGIVHRDVSPHNILVTREGLSKILDFGIAKAAGKTTVTSPGLVRGKATYMSPEQAAGEPLDALSDQFSLGTVLYELTTGRRLFARETDTASMKAIVNNEVPRPTSFMTYSPGLELITMQALAPDPKDRFRSCEELADALEEFLRTEKIPHGITRVSRFMEDLFGDDLQSVPTIGEEDTTAAIGPVRGAVPESAETGSSFVALVGGFMTDQQNQSPDDEDGDDSDDPKA